MWADRILNSAITRQLIEPRLAAALDPRAIIAAWTEWAANEDRSTPVLHGELVYRVITPRH